MLQSFFFFFFWQDTQKQPQHPIRVGYRETAGLAGSLKIYWDYHPITTVSRVHSDWI